MNSTDYERYYESICQERESYAEYDQEMTDALEQEYTEEEEYYYQNDSLLNLVLGVQTYLAEQTKLYGNKVSESPLYSLQYKMYTYMRQRVFELGLDVTP